MRRQKDVKGQRTNLWIGTGALVVALATGLSRTGDYSFVYAGELVGLSLMFAGFSLPPPRRRARTAHRPGGGGASPPRVMRNSAAGTTLGP